MYRHALTVVLGSDAQKVGAQFVEVSEPIAPHTHDFVEIALVVAGSGRHHSRTGVDDAVPGSVFLIRPGSWHGFDATETLTVANVYFDEHVLFDSLPWLFSDPVRSRQLLSAGTSHWRAPVVAFRETVKWVTELEKQGTAPHMIRVGLLTCIMALVTHLGDPASSEIRSTPARELSHEAVARIAAEPNLGWTIDVLAASANMSPSHFSRVFREETGTSPARFVARVRLERAAQLLASTNASVARVGAQVGIDDANYFSRIFRRTYGDSPSQYRARFGAIETI